MSKSITLLFKIADVLAWLMIVISMLTVLAMPFIEPEYYALKNEPVPWVTLSGEAFLHLLLCLGFYLHIKRKLIGFVFISAAFAGYTLLTGNVLNLVVLVGVFVIFGLPWGLGYIEHQRNVQET